MAICERVGTDGVWKIVERESEGVVGFSDGKRVACDDCLFGCNDDLGQADTSRWSSVIQILILSRISL